MTRVESIIAGVVALALAPAIAVPVPKNGQCPAGYRETGGFCAPLRPGNAWPAVPKPKGQQCPSNWYQSGNYCVMMPR